MTVWKLLASAALLLLCACLPAWAASNGDGDLIVNFRGGIEPKQLPREELVPVAVSVEGNIKSASGNLDQLPQLRRIVVAINREGVLDDHGLPVCRASQIQPATERAARHICGPALVGKGHLTVQVRVLSQNNFIVHANVLAFNGPRQGDHKLILVQAYALNPPAAFILTFHVKRTSGTYGTVLSTTLPRAAQGWAYLVHFDLTLHRTFIADGKRHSYVSAGCGAPAGLNEVLFPFARATYSFDSGQALTMSESETCRVAE